MTFDESTLPCLYLVWPSYLLSEPPRADVPDGYVLRSYDDSDDFAIRQLLECESWKLSEKEWQDYKDQVLPNGLFLITHTNTNGLVATAGAVHKPNPGRYYFPFGGNLEYLIVHPEHRGKQLGSIVSAMVVQRFISAGYDNIRVCVQGFRVAAIKTYLRLGFVPFLHGEDIYLRWQKICEQVDWPFEPNKWPKSMNHNQLQDPVGKLK